MAKSTTLNQDKNNDDSTPLQLIRLNNTERTAVQIKTLLEVVSSCENAVILIPESGCTVEMEDVIKKSATETYLAAQIRLRDLLDDQARWDLADEKDDQAADLVEGNLMIQDAQMAALKASQLPHRRLNCQLKLFDAGWIAWTGSDNPMSDVLHGIGRSPEEALNQFDKNYSDTSMVTPAETPETPEKK
jgi:hypothetical protein